MINSAISPCLASTIATRKRSDIASPFGRLFISLRKHSDSLTTIIINTIAEKHARISALSMLLLVCLSNCIWSYVVSATSVCHESSELSAALARRRGSKKKPRGLRGSGGNARIRPYFSSAAVLGMVADACAADLSRDAGYLLSAFG